MVVEGDEGRIEHAQPTFRDDMLMLGSQRQGNHRCRDPEGNLWSFGSYDPWVSPS